VKNSANISQDWIENLIRNFIATSPQNTMKSKTEEPAWDDVLIGFASGADSIWQQYKEYIGAFHWTPWEVFSQHCPEESAGAEELTVISWVLPQRALVRKANRKAKKYPAEEWARIRIYGEEFNAALRKHVAKSLEQTGHAAIAPMLVSNWTIVNSQRFLVRTPCRPCGRSGHLRSVRRADHRKGQSHAGWIGSGQAIH
jgi:hypothetical protein